MSLGVNGRFRVSVDGPLRVAEAVTLQLHYTPPAGGLQTGGNLWFFFDIRQLDEWVLNFESPEINCGVRAGGIGMGGRGARWWRRGADV